MKTSKAYIFFKTFFASVRLEILKILDIDSPSLTCVTRIQYDRCGARSI